MKTIETARVPKHCLYLISFVVILNFVSSFAHALPNCRDAWRGSDRRYIAGENYETYLKTSGRSDCEKDWTILVYMAADNNLFPYALWDLYEMEARYESSNQMAGSTLKSDLIVHVDGTGDHDQRIFHIFADNVAFRRNRTLEEFKREDLEMVKSPIVKRVREDPSVSEGRKLSNFLNWAIETYPSKHLMVIVWSHGQGWKAYPVDRPLDRGNLLSAADLRTPEFPSIEKDRSFGGIAFRASSGHRLDIPALRSVLKDVRSQKLTNRKIDVYASDACLMQMIEVATELSSEADYIFGTTQIQNFLGLPYRRMMYEINTGRFLFGNTSENEPYMLSKMLPELVKKSLDPRSGLQREAGRDSHRFVTASVLTTAELEKFLIRQLEQLSFDLLRFIQSDPLRSLDLNLIQQNVPSIEGGSQDLAIFLGFLELLVREERSKRVLDSTAIKLMEQIGAVKAALNRSTLAYVYGDAYGVEQASKRIGFIPRAVSLWLPVSLEEYAKRKNEFLASKFYKSTGWARWLDALYGL